MVLRKVSHDGNDGIGAEKSSRASIKSAKIEGRGVTASSPTFGGDHFINGEFFSATKR